MKDKVKWFDDEKGHGFIEYKGKNVFIRLSTEDGESVELELVKIDNGYELKNVSSTKAES